MGLDTLAGGHRKMLAGLADDFGPLRALQRSIPAIQWIWPTTYGEVMQDLLTAKAKGQKRAIFDFQTTHWTRFGTVHSACVYL